MNLRLPLKVLRNPLALLRWAHWRVARRRRRTLTASTRQGRLTVFSADCGLGRSLFCFREFEFDWINRVMRFLRECGRLSGDRKGTVLDIGANMGVISIGMLHAGRMDRAIAVEPDPGNFDLLARNVRQNGYERRFVCLQVALSDKAGALKFELSDDNYGDHRVRADTVPPPAGELYRESSRRAIEVPARRLDDVLEGVDPSFANDIALVWIDVQGYEGHVFMGGDRFFRRGVPVATEVWPYGLRRAGLDLDRYCDLVGDLWSCYWAFEEGRFVRHPASDMRGLLARLGDGEAFTNVILLRD